MGEGDVVHVVIREVLATEGGGHQSYPGIRGLPNAAEPLQEPEHNDGENEEQKAEADYDLLPDEAGLLWVNDRPLTMTPGRASGRRWSCCKMRGRGHIW